MAEGRIAPTRVQLVGTAQRTVRHPASPGDRAIPSGTVAVNLALRSPVGLASTASRRTGWRIALFLAAAAAGGAAVPALHVASGAGR